MQGTTNVIILPKYFESMFGDADQLINMKLRLTLNQDSKFTVETVKLLSH